ncbi:MAG: sulfatase-like hydrolase/transferase [Pirellulales bacterium]
MSHGGKVISSTGEGSQVTVDLALEFIEAAVMKQQPFAAVVWFGSPHTPHVALDADREAYRQLPENMQHYYGEITAMDRAVGKLRARLRELKIADDTLLWFTSDNGATVPGSSGPFKGKKGTLWEGGIRVPSLLEWPAKFAEPRHVTLRASTCDVLPTVVAAAGLQHPDLQRPLDGESLLPFCVAPSTADDDGEDLAAAAKTNRSRPLGFWTYPQAGKPVRSGSLLKELEDNDGNGDKPTTAGGPLLSADETAAFAKKYPTDHFPGHAAWVDGRYKLHRIAREQEKPVFHLFDLASDPEEKTDLATSDRARLEQMAEALEAWQASVVRSLNGEDYAR